MMTHQAVNVLLEWSFGQNKPVQEEFVNYYGSMHEYFINNEGYITADGMKAMIRSVEDVLDK